MSDESVDGNPYAPPVDVAPAPFVAPGDGGRRQATLAVVHLVAAFPLFFVVFAFAAGLNQRTVGAVGFGIVTLVLILGALRGIVALVQAARAGRATIGFSLGMFALVLASGFMSLMGAAMTLLATNGFSRGRQLRRFGRVLLPEVRAGGAWAELSFAPVAPEPVRRALAAQWRENGRTEHASVAAFARLTLDLMALGAPPALIAAANKDALDEIRHTELCFSLARALDGADESPAAFPEAQRARTLPASRPLALAALAVDSLVDGALHEGISARVIARLVKRCEEPRIRTVLKEIAADEGRHAAHGWDVVRWCLAEGGATVADALRGAIVALPRTIHTPLPEAAVDGGWERFGIHGRALEVEEHARTRADIVRRVEELVGDAPAAAA